MKEQQYMEGFEPSEEDMVNIALNMPHEKKVEKSINAIRHYEPQALKMNPLGYNVRDSGGKDSCAQMKLAEMAGVKYYSTYSNTTIDPPELQEFIRKYHPETKWVESGRGHLIMDRMVEKLNMPTRRGKWCCSEYKNCCSSQSCEKSMKMIGVRISESAKRAKAWKQLTVTERGDTVLAPIAYWTDEDVWRFLKENDVPYCELYDQGWSRLGCVGCPINPKSQAKEFERWPEIEAMWKEGARLVWEKSQTTLNRKGEKRYWTKFKTPEDMWDWWITGKHAEKEPNCVFEEMMENT